MSNEQRSLMEEVIATLWTIIFILLWIKGASQLLMVAIGVKVFFGHLSAVKYAIQHQTSPRK